MTDPIKHVILLMLENHSFDQMLGCFHPLVDGVDPEHPILVPCKLGEPVRQQEMRETQMLHDPWHETRDVLQQLRDGNSGFVDDFLSHYPDASRQELEALVGYYPRGFLPALHALAENYTVCDHWYSALPGPTWPNRFFVLTGTSMGMVRMPENNRDFGMLTNQTQDTIFDRLTGAGRSWKIFYYDFPCSLILQRMREQAKRPHYRRIDEFFKLCQGEETGFPDFSFIEPKYDGFDQNDDHPPHNVMKAQKLIADVYNALRSNDGLWESTLLVVLYDEHGGFYDHVVPPPRTPFPGEAQDEYTFDRLGVRVPALLVSPWVDARVESTAFDHTSLLKYLTEKWNLASLTPRVTGATSIAIALKRGTARKDAQPLSIRVPYTGLISNHPEWELVDQSRHHSAIALALEHLEQEAEEYAGHLDEPLAEGEALSLASRALGAWYRLKRRVPFLHGWETHARNLYSGSRRFNARMGAHLLSLGNHLMKAEHRHRAGIAEKATRAMFVSHRVDRRRS